MPKFGTPFAKAPQNTAQRRNNASSMKTMTTNRTLSIALTALLLAGGLGACKPKKDKAQAETTKPPSGETEVNVLCSGPEFFTNDQVFRANNLGESMDQATSKKKAMSNARADLAAAINTRVKAVIDNYVKLAGVKTICEKQVTVNATGNYKTYVAIELSAQDLLAAYNERLSKDERLRVDYDYEKFKETFDKEMEKLGK